MAAIEEAMLDPGWTLPGAWDTVAERTLQWLAGRALPVPDAVVLVPFTALLAPLRQALAARGGWQPRVETVRTLAAAVAPAPPLQAQACVGEDVHDRLAAARLLRAQALGARWAQRDAVGFERVVTHVVAAAQALRGRAAASVPGAARAAFFDRVRRQAEAQAGSAAADDAALLQLAIEWAALSVDAVPPATDAVHALAPSAWVLVRIGGTDPLADGVAAGAAVPVLRLWLDPRGEVPPALPPPETDGAAVEGLPPGIDPDLIPFAPICRSARVERFACEGFEAETQAAATVVIEALNAGRAPVALVALDRELVRRVRALLERRGVAVIDETGWVLSTTRAGATVRALLRAALPGATNDDWLEWLKSSAAAAGSDALDTLEALWRGRRPVGDADAARALWRQAKERLLPLADAGPQPLHAWLALLRGVLVADGTARALADDAAGAQLLRALRLDGTEAEDWREVAEGVPLTLAGLGAWVASTLEATRFLPPADPAAQVVLTPLGRIGGRWFAHTVVAGADHRHLGPVQTPAQLIGDRMAAALGLPDGARRRWEQRLSLGHLLRAGPVTFLRRLQDDGQALADSPDVLWLATQAVPVGSGAGWPPLPWRGPAEPVQPRPVEPPMPVAAGALPARLSASQLETLRQCPYRFFARAVLRLDEPEEIDAALGKRDYGTWLHAVLHRFHAERTAGRPLSEQLQAAAAHVTRQQRLDPGELLPFSASFERFAPDYLAWLKAREDGGWHWSDGETDHAVAPPVLGGLRLHGRIDRLDHGPGGRRQLLDYKTGSGTSLGQRTRDPLEDTQLAFYALLLGAYEVDAQDDGAIDAAYLALDDADAPREVRHEEVAQTASRLLAGLADDWRRLRAGHPLPALGQPPVCDHCESRGLCRRDQWRPGAQPGPVPAADAVPAGGSAGDAGRMRPPEREPDPA